MARLTTVAECGLQGSGHVSQWDRTEVSEYCELGEGVLDNGVIAQGVGRELA
jgi:hypothetical protein